MELKELGWNEFHENHYNDIKTPETFPARVAKAQREKYLLYSAFGQLKAEIKGKIRFEALSMADFPVVGDWVAAQMRPEGNAAVIKSILPRKSKFSRKVAGPITDEQVLVSNIDTAFLVNGLDGDYNLRRIERYLALAWESSANPVILLNKTDSCSDLAQKLAEVESIAFGVPIVTLSALKSEGIEGLRKFISRGATIGFIGSSGVGKSTIINRLIGEDKLKVGAVRESDGRGRHITTSREMILLSGGGIVIDNPGMRELQLWVDEEALDTTFGDVREFAAQCKFRDCEHSNEPGCAVREAIEAGRLDAKRFSGFLKLKKEQRYLATRKEAKAHNAKIISEKKISKFVKQLYKHRSINTTK